MKLSVIMPVYNEIGTIEEILRRIESQRRFFEIELIIIDDASTDGTRDLVKALDTPNVKVLLHQRNQGKGAAVRTGLPHASGHIVLIQDADLEYNPEDYGKVIEPIVSGWADIVFSSRFAKVNNKKFLSARHYLGNRLLTGISNIFTGQKLTDMASCYKAIRRDKLELFVHRLEAKRFAIDCEIAAYAAKHNLQTTEVEVSYACRTRAEGKKINWKDGASVVWHIVKYNIIRR